MKEEKTVKTGQIWQDWDIRFRKHEPIYKYIYHIDRTHAHCFSITKGRITRGVKIRLERFKPNSTGYILTNNNFKVEHILSKKNEKNL